MNRKLTDEHLRRRAIVYVRQSTPAQLLHNRESQRRQYGLADYARSLGFQDVETMMTISAVLPPAAWNDLAFSASWRRYAPDRSGPCSASRPRV